MLLGRTISIKMATALKDIADSLVPEDQRKKPDKKLLISDSDDEDFAKQLELALKLSLNETKPDFASPKIDESNSTSSSAKNKKTKRFRKLREQELQQNLTKRPDEANITSSGNVLFTNDITKLTFEEQLQLAQARSKFDTTEVLSSSSSASSVDEDDLYQVALQKSVDPAEQVDLEHRLILEAIEASKAEEKSNAFLDSDASSSTSTSTSASASFRPSVDLFMSTRQLPKIDSSLARHRGTNRRSAHQQNHFKPDLDFDEDEDLKLAIQLSMGLQPQLPMSNGSAKNTYSAAAQKPVVPVQLRPDRNRNVYADPTKVISNPNPAKSCPGMRRRPIIVDGCNVAFQHGKNDRFSAKGLLLVYQYFVQRHGYTNDDVTIVSKTSRNLNDEDKEIVESLYKIDVLIYSPSRFAGGRYICSDDDLFVLNLAKEKNGVVVSLDQFRDAYVKTRDRDIKDVIKHRLLQFAFKGDEIIFPRDPLGPNGPTLEEFLRY